MTKTEQRYAELLEHRKIAGEIRDWKFEPVTFRLAKLTTYTPDFQVVLPSDEVIYDEVKPNGWRHIPNQDMGNVKIKVAAEMMPFTFRRAVERKQKDGGGFDIEEIQP